MGRNWIDQFSLLHFSIGVVAQFLGIPIVWWIIITIVFELVENSSWGVKFINEKLSWFWPGGKDGSDAAINQVTDVIFGILGWVIAYCIN